MTGTASVAILLLVLLPEGVYVQVLSIDEENKLIEEQNDCKCVYYYQCANDTVISDGGPLIQRRINTRISCKGGFADEFICCKLKTPNLQTSQRGYIDTELDLAPVIVTDEEENNCGVQKTVFHSRIHSDEEDVAPIEGEFPWMAVIFASTDSGEHQFLCSGSLIHPKVVMTIAHKVNGKKASELKVLVNGKIVMSEEDQAGRAEKRHVSEIVSHPDYNNNLLYNDVALLILKKNFKLKEGLHPINTLCLPPATVNLEGGRCFVAGWGDDKSGKRTKVLKKVEVPFVNHSQCETLLQGTRLGRYFHLHESFMCAGGEKGKDACTGDGGSPLMCPMYVGSTKLFQAGIVSWGVDCGMEHIPGVYSNVQLFLDWIRRELRNRKLSI